jgi:hypothetical protein
MELSGVLMVLLLLSRVARSWIATGRAPFELADKNDDARDLVYAVGKLLCILTALVIPKGATREGDRQWRPDLPRRANQPIPLSSPMCKYFSLRVSPKSLL